MSSSTFYTWKPFSCLGNVMSWVDFVHHSQAEFVLSQIIWVELTQWELLGLMLIKAYWGIMRENKTITSSSCKGLNEGILIFNEIFDWTSVGKPYRN